MADDNEETQDPRSLYQKFLELAKNRGLEDDDVDDFIEIKMKKAGFKKGPGDWISLDDDEDEKDDDNTPMTRGDWRRMRRQQQQANARQLPKKEPETKTQKSGTKDPWW